MSELQNDLIDKKVAVISDSEDQVEYFRKSFLCAGARVAAGSLDGNTLDYLKNEEPDLVIVESTKSALSSGELLKSIRKDKKTEKLPVILITENDSIDQTDFDNTKFVSKKSLDVIDIFTVVKELMVPESAPKTRLLDINDPVSLPVIDKNKEEIRVVVLEDDPLLRDLLSTKFTKSKVPFRLWHSGDGAVPFIENYKPTVMIFDITLPGKSGLDVLAEIREVPEFKNIPTIVFSNNDNPEERERASKLGVDKYLVKAVTDLNDLISLILKLNRRSSN